MAHLCHTSRKTLTLPSIVSNAMDSRLSVDTHSCNCHAIWCSEPGAPGSASRACSIWAVIVGQKLTTSMRPKKLSSVACTCRWCPAWMCSRRLQRVTDMAAAMVGYLLLCAEKAIPRQYMTGLLELIAATAALVFASGQNPAAPYSPAPKSTSVPGAPHWQEATV